MTTDRRDGRPARRRRRPAAWLLASLGAALIPALATRASATEIRSHAANRVPACVTPDRLMTFLAQRNAGLDPRYRNIARLYKQHGEAWRVRWDYAFFQMAVETNYLAFRRPDGRSGDVRPAQNNFAGLGTTGGGVPGDSYPDVSTGVLAQIQHLVAYSGERLAAPVGPRTRLKQDDIVAASLRLGRPVRFADLARRWAVDPAYGRSIEWVAERYREAHCASAAAPSESRSLLGGEPKLIRAPEAVTTRGWSARAPSAPADGKPAAKAAVRTVWSRARPGDVPLLPETGPVPAPRRLSAVAAGATDTAPSAMARPVETTDAPPPPAVVAADPAASQPAVAAPAPSPAPAPPATTVPKPRLALRTIEVAEPPAIRLSAAAVPYAGGRVVAETSGTGGICRIALAGGGGQIGDDRSEQSGRHVLIRSVTAAATDLVVLAVLSGFEASMAESFIRTRLPGGAVEAAFGDRDTALAHAHARCSKPS